MITSRSATSSFGIVAIATAVRSRPHRIIAPGLLEELWRKTAVPLLIVNPQHTSLNGAQPHAPDTIVVPCMRGTDDAALSIASAIAGASRSRVKIVSSKSSSTGEIEDKLINMFTSDEVAIEILQGGRNVIGEAHALQADNPGSWIVVGSKMRSGIRRSILGSSADMIARESQGPVVVVPDPKVTERRRRSASEATRNLASAP